MAKYEYKGEWYTPNQLAEMSGVLPHTIRDRLRRGYPVEEAIKMTVTHESVKEFCEASYYHDWLGMSISDLHTIYWKWCIQHGYTALQKQGFSRQLMGMYPMLKIVPTNRDGTYHRIIRLRG